MVAKSEVAGCSSRPFLAMKSLFLRPSPRNFRASGALLGGAARRGRQRRTPPSIEHTHQPLHLVDPLPGPAKGE